MFVWFQDRVINLVAGVVSGLSVTVCIVFLQLEHVPMMLLIHFKFLATLKEAMTSSLIAMKRTVYIKEKH